MKAEDFTTWDRISVWWRFEGRYYHKDFIYGIKNLFRWFKLVWKDRDYDDAFIFEPLKFKIKKTMEYTERRKFFVGWEHEVSRMRICIKLIDSIQDNKYGLESFDYQKTTHKFIPSEEIDKNGKNYFELVSEVVEDNLDLYFKKHHSSYKKVLKKYKGEHSRMSLSIKLGYEVHNKAKKLLFNILDKHIENWWE